MRTAAFVADGVARRRHRRPGDGDARRRRGHRPRRVQRRAGAHAVLRPGGVGGGRAALHRRHRRDRASRSAARRPTSPRSATGRPALSYVRVASHATALRSVDVRVVGVAGGSMLRVRRGRRATASGRAARTSPGCPTPASLTRPSVRRGDRRRSSRPAPATPRDYVAIAHRRRRARAPLTTTCAANFARHHRARRLLLRRRRDGRAPRSSWRRRRCRLDAETIARHMLDRRRRGGLRAGADAWPASAKLRAADDRRRRRRRRRPGPPRGGRCSAGRRRSPTHAEVISSIGDALSLLRAERERTVEDADAATLEAMMDEVEARGRRRRRQPGQRRGACRGGARAQHRARRRHRGGRPRSPARLPGREPARRRRASRAACRNGTVVDGARPLTGCSRHGDGSTSSTATATSAIDVDGEHVDATTSATAFESPHPLPRPGDAAPDGVDHRRRRLVELARSTPPTTPTPGVPDVTYLVGQAALMALYVSARRRRTRAAIGAAVVGLLAFGLGLLVGRQQVPSVGERIAAVQRDAGDVATGLERLDIEYAKVLAGTDSLDEAVLAPIDQAITRAQHALDGRAVDHNRAARRARRCAGPDPPVGGGRGSPGHVRRPPARHRRPRPLDVRRVRVAGAPLVQRRRRG